MRTFPNRELRRTPFGRSSAMPWPCIVPRIRLNFGRAWWRVRFSGSGPALCGERRLPPRKSGQNGGASRPPRPLWKIGKRIMPMGLIVLAPVP